MFIFIETKLFTRLADEHLAYDELSRLQGYLNENAEAGAIITRGDLAAYVVGEKRGGEHFRRDFEED